MMEHNQEPLQTPVLFLVFNRPDTTQKVFEAIRAARPTRLFVAADGPRPAKKGEKAQCEKVRAIATAVDWECELNTFFREENAGCGKAVSSGITWFFEQVEEGIILEDDCLPTPELFPFCTTLLEKYRDDTRVMEIGGVSLLHEDQRDYTYSYFFSTHNNIWGWATWRRAWQLYDYTMTKYKDIMDKGFFDDYFNSIHEESYFRWVFERTYRLPSITWDYQWEFIRRIHSGLTIFPVKNLVINLGFGDQATHTSGDGGASGQLQLEKLEFPLRHPEFILPDVKADTQGFVNHHTSSKSRLKNRLKNWLPKSIRNKLFRHSMDGFVRAYRSQHKPVNDTATDNILINKIYHTPEK
jgi:hypothetical protein